MSQKTFSLVAGVIFLVIAIMHVLRLVLKWEAVVNGRAVPMWVSWVGVPIAGYLAYEGFRLSQWHQLASIVFSYWIAICVSVRSTPSIA